MAIVANSESSGERCRYPGCGAFTRTGLLCPEHLDEANKFTQELKGVSQSRRIDLFELMVDTRFQREPHEGRIESIRRNFNEYDLGFLVASERTADRLGEGHYALLDGQQRWNALLRLGFKWAPCEVIQGLTLEQEIMVFCVRNKDRTPVRRALMFNDMAKAGIEPYRTATALLESFGYKLDDSGPRSKVTKNRFTCPGTLETVHRMGRLSPTLFAIRRAWDEEAEPNRSEVVMGIATFLQLNQHIPADALGDALGRFNPEELVGNAASVTKASIDRRLWVHFYEQVVQAYNFQKQQANRVPRQEISPRAPKIWFN
jgi:hypothetical protein